MSKISSLLSVDLLSLVFCCTRMGQSHSRQAKKQPKKLRKEEKGFFSKIFLLNSYNQLTGFMLIPKLKLGWTKILSTLTLQQVIGQVTRLLVTLPDSTEGQKEIFLKKIKTGILMNLSINQYGVKRG